MGAWLRNPGQLPRASNHKYLHTATQGPRVYLVRKSLWLEAYVVSQPGRCPGWARGGGLDSPKTRRVSKTLLAAPQGPQTSVVRYKFWLGAYFEFQSMGWPGWAWEGWWELWWEAINARGSRPHKGGFAQNTTQQTILKPCTLSHPSLVAGAQLPQSLRGPGSCCPWPPAR